MTPLCRLRLALSKLQLAYYPSSLASLRQNPGCPMFTGLRVAPGLTLSALNTLSGKRQDFEPFVINRLPTILA